MLSLFTCIAHPGAPESSWGLDLGLVGIFSLQYFEHCGYLKDISCVNDQMDLLWTGNSWWFVNIWVCPLFTAGISPLRPGRVSFIWMCLWIHYYVLFCFYLLAMPLACRCSRSRDGTCNTAATQPTAMTMLILNTLCYQGTPTTIFY